MPGDRNHRSSSGAYGFRLVSGNPGEQLPDLPVVDGDAPLVHFRWERGSRARGRARGRSGPGPPLAPRRRSRSPCGGNRPRQCGSCHSRCRSRRSSIPLGTLPLSVLAHWRGDVTLHGGAFVRAGGAWGVCGEQNAGKSTTLALVGDAGHPDRRRRPARDPAGRRTRRAALRGPAPRRGGPVPGGAQPGDGRRASSVPAADGDGTGSQRRYAASSCWSGARTA